MVIFGAPDPEYQPILSEISSTTSGSMTTTLSRISRCGFCRAERSSLSSTCGRTCFEFTIRPVPSATRRFPGAMVSGAYNSIFVIDTLEDASVVGAHFKLGGAFPFLGLPASELADLHADPWKPLIVVFKLI